MPHGGMCWKAVKVFSFAYRQTKKERLCIEIYTEALPFNCRNVVYYEASCVSNWALYSPA